MNFPTYKAGPVEYWIGEAMTQFVNGFIAGWKHAVGTGASTGILTGGIIPGTNEAAQHLSQTQQILVSAGAAFAAMFMSGVSQVSSWHENGNPFPNPWPKPTGNTTPPFPPAPRGPTFNGAPSSPSPQ